MIGQFFAFKRCTYLVILNQPIFFVVCFFRFTVSVNWEILKSIVRINDSISHATIDKLGYIVADERRRVRLFL